MFTTTSICTAIYMNNRELLVSKLADENYIMALCSKFFKYLLKFISLMGRILITALPSCPCKVYIYNTKVIHYYRRGFLKAAEEQKISSDRHYQVQ